MAVIAGKNHCNSFALKSKQGDIILQVETLPSGDVEVIGEIYNSEGKLVARINREEVKTGDAGAELTIG